MKNLTPHAIIIRTEQGDIELPPSGELARVSTKYVDSGITFAGGEALIVPVVLAKRGTVTGLPEEGPLLVSGMVLDALRAEGCSRSDVFAPDTGSTAVRNENGHIVAVTRLIGL